MALSMGHPRGTYLCYVIGCCLILLGICGLKNNSRRITYGIGCVWGMSSLSPLSSLAGLKKDRRINWGKKTFYWNLTILINFLDFQILHSQIHCPIGSYICVNTKCEVKDGWIMAKLICFGGRYYDGLRQIQGQQNCKKKNIRLISSHLNQTSLKEVIIWPRELFSCGKNILCGQHRPTCLLK